VTLVVSSAVSRRLLVARKALDPAGHPQVLVPPIMKIARVESRCECQAQLVAELDEARSVVRGFVNDRSRGREISAPANVTKTIDQKQVDIGWSCPICTRNTLRTFNVEALSYR
jgi:hypothetical protein